MPSKVIEVCYDIDSIPGCTSANSDDPKALGFRDAAQMLIEDALILADLGAGIDAGTGPGEVTFRMIVADFDAAEHAIWEAVWSTPYHRIREILRYWEANLAA